jgi:hypothetical protein
MTTKVEKPVSGALLGFVDVPGLPPWAAAQYRTLRAALPPGELSAQQERYLRWLSQWDGDTTDTIASLFRFAAGKP